jgi:hypothetical protein
VGYPNTSDTNLSTVMEVGDETDCPWVEDFWSEIGNSGALCDILLEAPFKTLSLFISTAMAGSSISDTGFKWLRRKTHRFSVFPDLALALCWQRATQ